MRDREIERGSKKKLKQTLKKIKNNSNNRETTPERGRGTDIIIMTDRNRGARVLEPDQTKREGERMESQRVGYTIHRGGDREKKRRLDRDRVAGR